MFLIKFAQSTPLCQISFLVYELIKRTDKFSKITHLNGHFETEFQTARPNVGITCIFKQMFSKMKYMMNIQGLHPLICISKLEPLLITSNEQAEI